MIMAYQNSQYQNGQSILALTPGQLDNLSNGLKRGGFGLLIMGIANINASSKYGRQKVTIKTEMRGQSPHLVFEVPCFINNFNGTLQQYNLLNPNEQNQNKSVSVTLHVVDAKANEMCQLAYQGYFRAGVQFMFVGYDKPEQTSKGSTRHIIYCCMLCVSRWSMKPDAAVLEIDDQRNKGPQNNVGAPVPNGGYPAPGGQYNSNGGYYNNAGAPAQNYYGGNVGATIPGGSYGGNPGVPASAGNYGNGAAPAQNGYAGNAGAPAPGGNYGGGAAPAQNGYSGNAGAPTPGGNYGGGAAPAQNGYAGNAGAPAPGGNYNGGAAPAQNGYAGNAGAPTPGGNYGSTPAPAQNVNGGNAGTPASAPQQSPYPGRDPIVGPTSEEMSAVLDDEGDLPF